MGAIRWIKAPAENPDIVSGFSSIKGLKLIMERCIIFELAAIVPPDSQRKSK
jgi:hypothetical protein